MIWPILAVFSPLIVLMFLHLYVTFTEHHIEQQKKDRQDDE